MCTVTVYFNLHIWQFIIKEALGSWDGGIIIGGKNISDLRYADATVLLLYDKGQQH